MRPGKLPAVVSVLALLAGVFTVGATVAFDAEPASAAASPSQVWMTAVGPDITTSGGSMDATFGTSGVSALITATAGGSPSAAGNLPSASGQLGLAANAATFLEPDAPTGSVSVTQSLWVGGRFTETITLNKPVLAPMLHVYNLDGSFVDVAGTTTTGAPITLTPVVKNDALEILGNRLNSTPSQAVDAGCQADDGTTPSAGCGSFRLGGTSGLIESFTLTNVGAIGGDAWSYTLSFPTLPLTKEFSPTQIPVGGTSQLTFSLTNPNDSAQPDMSQLSFADNLPAGVTLADGTVSDNGSCGTPAVTAPGGAALAAGGTEISAADVSVAVGATCTVTVNVTSGTVGSYTNDNDNLSSGVANLIPNADTTLQVVDVPPSVCNVAPNGSFEEPNVQSNPNFAPTPGATAYASFLTNQATISGWSVVSGTVDILRWYSNASEGAQSIDLFGVSPGVLEQTFTGLVPGAEYTFGLDYSGRDTVASAGTVSLANGGALTPVQTLTPVANAAAGGTPPAQTSSTVTWAPFTHTFTAAATSATVRIANAPAPGPGGTGLFIDNFSFDGPCTDFGDAPRIYDTQTVDDGPRHLIGAYDAAASTGDLMLGSTIDNEADGPYAGGAIADDMTDAADEDGVSAPIDYDPNTPETVEVAYTNDTGAEATLAGWIDLDRNGVFDAGERQVVPVPTGAGTVDMTFPALSGAGNTYSRFRLFPGTVADPSPLGLVLGGEVEDYRVFGPPTVLTCEGVPNGSFEEPVVDGHPDAMQSPPGVASYLTNQSTMTGWNVVAGTVDILRWFSNPSDGDQSIDMWGVSPAAIEQSFTGLVPGEAYTFSVDYSGMSTTLSTGTVSLDTGSGLVDLQTLAPTVDGTPGGTPPASPSYNVTWSTFTHTFVATSADATIRITNQDPPGPINTGLFIDNFQMTAPGCDLFDFGDAPDSYGTTLAPDGPRHGMPGYDESAGTASVMLGSSIDEEDDGQPNAAADGDGADEDGVTFNPSLIYPNPTLRTGVDPTSQQPISNTLEVDASADGFVSVWVDWDQNGDFSGAGEQVANAQAVTAGSNDVTFSQGTNPPGIESYVRVRYSSDAASIAAPTGAAPDGEVEDYRVLVERLIQPDTCNVTDTDYYAFTFAPPAAADRSGNGGVGSTARYRNVTVVDGVAVDMFVEVTAGTLSTIGFFTAVGDDAGWNVLSGATVRYRFYEAGTTTPVEINGVFTVNDMDGAPDTTPEIGTWDADDLAAYAITQGSRVEIVESADSVAFIGHGFNNGDPVSRFQVVLEGRDTFEVKWQGSSNAGFTFDGDGDIGIQPPACQDFGDAPDSYGTTIGANGPNHTLVNGVKLGTEIDFDTDGQPNAAADGDDTNRLADEDGVTFNPSLNYPSPTIRTGVDPNSQQPIENTLEVDASADGFVSVWVDWDQDGDFLDAGEQVANAQAVTAGNNDVTFSQGTNPPGIQTYVRVRYSTDPGSITTPTGAAPDGEVEDYQVLVERLIHPDTCTVSDVDYYAFTFELPAAADLTGTGGVASTARYRNVTVVDGVAVDMFVEVLAGDMREAGNGGAPPNGFWNFAPDDAAWQIDPTATLRYSFFETGTITPVDVNAVFTIGDLDSPESATFTAADLAGYAVTQGSTVTVLESGANVVFDGTSDGNLLPTQRFQVVFEGTSTFQAQWAGFAGSGFGFDGDGDTGIQPPACEDFGDAPDTYGTSIAASGANHTIVPGLLIGSEIDFDIDGQPNAAADGDESNRVADEDGVADAIEVTVGNETMVTVSATNSTTSDATLAGWIDLDGNGTFDASELVTIAVPAGSGTADYDLVFPVGSVTADTFARFRLFPGDVTSFSPTGPATAGEVEDYAVTVLEAQLEFGKTSDATEDSRPGDTITYTVTAENTGTGDFTAANPAVVLDDISGVLDDATFSGVATADRGMTPSYASPIISWVGELSAGEIVTIEYTVTLKAGGDGVVRNVAFGPGCDPADPDCDTTTPACDPPTAEGTDPTTGLPCAESELLLPKLTLTKVANTTELPVDGGEVEYTVTVTNAGPGVFTDAEPGTLTDDLSGVLDDGTVTDGPSVDVGTATFDAADESIEWSGALGVGEVATITYTVTYDSSTGDNSLLNVACLPVELAQDPADPCRSVQIPGSELQDRKSVNPASGTSVVAGQDVTYTLYFENTGQADATVDTFDDVSDVLDDATLTAGPTPSIPALQAVLNGSQIDITGTVPMGQTYTVTYTVTVNAFADQGDHILGNVLGGDAGCPAGDPTCRTENPIRHLTVTKTSDAAADVNVGDTVEYTVTVTNDGEADYTDLIPAVAEDDLTDVIDDATYQGDASSPSGTVSYASPILTWTGALAAGDSETFTYTVKVTNLGNHVMENVAGPVCATPEICEPPVTVTTLLPHVVPAKSSVPTSGEGVNAGDVVTYTLTWTNDGQAPGVVDATDDLSDVLDDGDVTVEPSSPNPAITVVRNGDEIRVTGPIQPSETVTVTYEVTIKSDGERGNNIAKNVLTPDVPPYLCEDGDTDCDPFIPPTTEHPIGEIEKSKTSDPASGTSVVAGQDVTYTLTYKNIGEAPVDVDTFDDASDVLDDAALTAGPISSDAAVTATLNGGQIDIVGVIPVDGTVTVTYTVTVDAFADQGDHILGNVLGECAEDDDTCRTEHLIRHITVTKTSDAATDVNTGDTVEYTVTVKNDGEGDYTAQNPAVAEDDLTDVLDDATYQGDASSPSGTVSYASPILTWTGALASGDSETFTYTVEVTNLGDHVMENVAGPVCADPEICEPPVTVTTLLPHVVPAKSSVPTSGEAVNAGDPVTYTLTWTNDGQAAGVVDATDDLSDVLDDGDVTVEPSSMNPAVTVTRTDDQLRVTGPIQMGETVTVTYVVTIKPDGERGNNIADNVLTQDVPPYLCEDGDADCDPFIPPTTEHLIGELDDWKTVDPASGSTVQPGQEVTYTLHFENIGKADVPVNQDDVLTKVLDDATITTMPVSSDPALTVSALNGDRFTVNGTLIPGQVVTVTYMVTVNADGARGDDRLGNSLVDTGEEPPEECVPTDGQRPDCTVNHVSNVVPSKSANPASGSEVAQDQKVTYTLTFENVSANPDAVAVPIDYTDYLVDVLDDATLTSGPLSSDAAVTAVVDGDTIRVTGAVASGDTVTVSYTVTVKAYDQQANHHLGNVIAKTGEDPICAEGSNLCTEHGLVPPPPPLALTGGTIAGSVVIAALVLMLAGGGALLISRRRRTTGIPVDGDDGREL